ncbi:AAA family ATPase [Salinispirillum sp. LH 10-3-1]|uniref:AAA family ATPase n=1 Tax=Salinispirillum sp. LH 10-3-1 TaxID=2952525 RepID=A0AB38YJ67_9GAMM
MKGFSNPEAREFLQRMKTEKNHEWFSAAITVIRATFPNADVWLTGGMDKQYIDVRIGRKTRDSKAGQPVLYVFCRKGWDEPKLETSESQLNSTFVLTPSSHRTVSELTAFFAENSEVFSAVKHKLEGSGLNPDDYGYEVSDDLLYKEKIIKSITLPLNQILYGPPGTGKTYETIRAALAILDPESVADYDAMMQPSRTPAEKQNARQVLKARFDLLHHDNYVQFVTFHQSFSYEDFVEGIRAEADEVTKQIQYQVVDGVFKSLCELADVRVTKQAEAPVDLSGRRVWKMSLGNTLGSDASIYDECIENDCILLGYGDNIDFSACNTRAEIRAQFEQQGISLNGNNDYNLTSVSIFITKMKLGDLVVVSDGNFKFRAIAEITGDYDYHPHPDYDDGYAQKRKVKWLRQFTPSLPHTELLTGQFSQMTLYELKKPSLDKVKLETLLGTKTSAASSANFSIGQVIGRDYKIVRVTPDLVELKKPNDNLLPFAMSMLDELATAVRQGKITVEDIRKKTAIEKLPGSNLEPYLVNGYQNVLAPLVQFMLSVNSEKLKGTAPNARVLIIDEINRGNISRIFGELITLIEPSKRAGAGEELEVVLPYSKKRFKVPSNLYIIGTMNTADRSLAGLDLALRRRFTFVEMPPKPELLDGLMVEGIDIGQMLRVMNQRITALLDRDHCIGHAYFMPLFDSPSLQRLADIFSQNILPLLQEYFFEDWQRIRWILADQTKSVSFAFVVNDEQIDAQQLFPSVAQFKPRECWRINTSAFMQVEAYQRIYQAEKEVTGPEA